MPFTKGHEQFTGIEKGWFKKGSRNNIAGEFKKGLIPWNKAQISKFCGNCGIEFFVNKYREKLAKFCSRVCKGNWDSKYFVGKNNPIFKGDTVGYRALHLWVERNLGKPENCIHCGITGLTGHLINWANKSGEYKRDLEDWLRLCVKCHREFDLKRRM